MNTLDLIILAMLAGGLVIGLRSGLIKQVVGFVGLIVAFALALHLMRTVGAMAAESLGISPDIAPLVGFVLVFLVVQLAVFALIRILESLIGALKLTAVNRFLGGAVGVFKACLVLSVTFLVLGYLGIPSDATKQSSSLYATVSTLMPKAWDYAATALPQLEKVSSQFGKEIQEHLPIEAAGGPRE